LNGEKNERVHFGRCSAKTERIMPMISRRSLVFGATGVAGLATFAGLGGRALGEAPGTFEVTRTDAEWRTLLTPEQYDILRNHGTERAWTSALLEEDRDGIYHCAGCDNALYPSETKYDSQTGWPSFWDALPNAVGTQEDRSIFFMVRTEVHCARCGGHLGHVFDDGPEPTGLRHCINGLALAFRPAGTA
jgi:peptide-methionine (R)-S-oxide reductase